MHRTRGLAAVFVPLVAAAGCGEDANVDRTSSLRASVELEADTTTEPPPVAAFGAALAAGESVAWSTAWDDLDDNVFLAPDSTVREEVCESPCATADTATVALRLHAEARSANMDTTDVATDHRVIGAITLSAADRAVLDDFVQREGEGAVGHLLRYLGFAATADTAVYLLVGPRPRAWFVHAAPGGATGAVETRWCWQADTHPGTSAWLPSSPVCAGLALRSGAAAGGRSFATLNADGTATHMSGLWIGCAEGCCRAETNDAHP